MYKSEELQGMHIELFKEVAPHEHCLHVDRQTDRQRLTNANGTFGWNMETKKLQTFSLPFQCYCKNSLEHLPEQGDHSFQETLQKHAPIEIGNNTIS